MSDYNPFEKSLRELSPADLTRLREVHEGWYVEYKAQLPNSASIAKSISAFANTYGGWLFYGIAEASRDNAVAGEFPGLARADVDTALQRIRQSAAESINPTPHFELRAVWGPHDAIGLKPDRAIIVVQVPAGHAAPFIHKSGLVYRRVADGSEPRPETDRYLLERLWRRGREVEKEYRSWLKRDLELSKGEADGSYLRLFITPDLWRDQDNWLDADTQTMRTLFAKGGDAERSYFATPFDRVYRTGRGFVARQGMGNDPRRLTHTWLLNRNLSSEVILPLHQIAGVHVDHLHHHLRGYECGAKFAEALRNTGDLQPRIVDLNFLFSSLVGIFDKQADLDEMAGRNGPLFVKAELIGFWRLTPFLDIPALVDHQIAHGVPMGLVGRMYAPPGLTPDSFEEVPAYEDQSPPMRRFLQAMIAFEPIAQALGIETGSDWKPDDEGTRPHIYVDLIGAASRAIEAQRLRNRSGEA